MRLLTVIGCALALIVPQAAQAHIIGKPKGKSLQARADFQQRNLSHVRYVCARGSGDSQRWHCSASRWLTREFGQTQAALARLHVGGNANVALGRQMASAYGWHVGYEWQSLYDLWNHESGWNERAHNTQGSGACGIPQSMTSCFGYDARRQIAWGLRYINGRYGRPSVALGHLRAHNWY